MINILFFADNDATTGFTCTINSTRFISTFVNNGVNYLFNRNCEYKLLSSCQPEADIDIRIDFLSSDFSTGNIVILYNKQRVEIRDGAVAKQPSPPSNQIIVSPSGTSVMIPAIELTVGVNTNVITINVANRSLSTTGLCGSLDGLLLFSDCHQQALNDSRSMSRFVSSHFVQALEQVVRPNREECGKD